MPIVLYRVDERLIHGQVVVGWGMVLHPDRIVVVDDELAGTPWEQELYALGLPAELDTRFVSVDDARARLEAWRADPERLVVLTRDIRTMRRLAAGGALAGAEVNIGGIHHAQGRDPVLPYVFLSQEERQDLRSLAELGAEVTARDLPGSRRFTLAHLLGED